LNSKNINSTSPILAIETSSRLCGACLYLSEEKYFQNIINFKNIHAEKLLEIVDSVLREGGVKTSDLGAVAVSNGPGSFTGLRIGMSAAKGMAVGASLPLIQVPTFEALALQISRFLPENTVFNIANKVNSDEVYFAKFQIKGNNYIFVENLGILEYSEFLSSSGDIITFGNAVKRKDEQMNFRNDVFAPEPGFVARWAAQYGETKSEKEIDYIEPYYLKNFTIKVRKND
jgi:tRNA threonylcarbamoyladenosine biosynthesis protein TsaB